MTEAKIRLKESKRLKNYDKQKITTEAKKA